MGCMICGLNIEEILTVIDDGNKKLVLCPNHAMGLVVGDTSLNEIDGAPSELKSNGDCVCCGNKAIYFKDSGTEYQVCEKHMYSLLRKNLTPTEWKQLSKTYGNRAFLLHDDFYTKDGIALQPATHKI